MPRHLGATLKPARHPFVYDNDPDSTTRPDTVPAALRFAEASSVSSGVVDHARPRELQPYPRLPEMTAANEATVVDPPLAPPKKELRSGTRHRPVTPASLASTIPPPSRARQKQAPAEAASERPVAPPEPPVQAFEQARIVTRFEEPRIITTSPPAAEPRKRWPFVVALVVTAMASAAAGTTLGNGSLERTVDRMLSSPGPREMKLPQASATREAPRSTAPLPSRATEPPEVNAAPVIRVEDLPLADQGTGKRVTASGRPVRKKAAVRR